VYILIKEGKITLIQVFLILVFLILNINIYQEKKARSYASLVQKNRNTSFFHQDHYLKELQCFSPILNDFPEFVSPVEPERRFLGTPLVTDKNPTLKIRAWYYSYYAGGVIEANNLLNSEKTAIIVVHSSGPHNNGSDTFQVAKSQAYLDHSIIVLKPFIEQFQDKVKLVAFLLQDSITVTGAAYSAQGKIIFYGKKSFEGLKTYLQHQGIENILLCGYTTDKGLKEAMTGQMNLRRDFNVFIVGDATLATFKPSVNLASSTSAALVSAALENFITQISWIQVLE